ncbi:OmpA family protein [Pseudozobellia sp. WGM2]|uniref:OmpA family protein n=1 Tax=Pseudozobellia sp. WGM2 TaxID=2787625 RepID=UPI001FD7A800|nr:OmpA family protein [Pseudozobellia sp. WGM2]
MKHLKYIVLSLVFSTSLLHGQEKKLERANRLYEGYAFASAAEQYEQLAQSGYQSPQLYKNLGNSYYYMSDLENAGIWYNKLLEIGEDVEPEYYFRYSHTLKTLGRYAEADGMMEKFDALEASDKRAVLFEEHPDYLEIIKLRSGKAEIKNEDFNSSYPDFGPSYFKEELIFASSRDTGTVRKRLHNWNFYPYLDLYKVSLSGDSTGQIDMFSKKLNTKYHECTPVFTDDGKTVYFTRNNFVHGKKGKDDKGVIRLKILRAKVDAEGNWYDAEELPFNGDEHSAAHPALSPDGTMLYFASDMQGTIGMSDIYMAQIEADGSIGEPRNIGAPVNTEGRDTYPFISRNGNLFFASDGHPGLGGLDIFAVPMQDNVPSDQVINLASPLNSNTDDFSLVLDESGLRGHFASNREGGHGSDDIYSVTFEELNFKCPAEGVIKDKETRETLADAKVVILDENGNSIAETVSDARGNFVVSIPCSGGKFKIVGTKKDFIEQVQEVTLPSDQPIALYLELEKVPAALGTDLAKTLNLKPIYFDFDKADIRPDAALELQKIIDYLQEFPTVKIEVGSHTDSRGSDSYNMKLSDRRAKSTMAYIVEKGNIILDRVSGKGYGETKPMNHCSNGVKCSEKEHDLNRRSEFIVMER